MWNDTARDYPSRLCVHQLIAQQSKLTPDHIAVIFDDDQLTYSKLDQLASRIAAMLCARGVKQGDFVGLCMERSAEMVAALLGILKAGAAYVPLDPRYPKARIGYMLEDSAVKTVITQAHLTPFLADTGTQCLIVDMAQLSSEFRAGSVATLPEHIDSGSAAYMIYTSGSTGKPKGVMVSHRNVVNFISAMKDTLTCDQGVWLAVTSLSFDISVLEIFGSLTAGFTVVVAPEQDVVNPIEGASAKRKPIDFSLMYFASSNQAGSDNMYHLLLEGAKYADQHGYRAVWTPERHFADFGGIFPNPAITSAAIATITKNIELRAGSCVLPLNDPVRVVEDWSVIDHLSNGRTGLAFASGWNINDFSLMPGNFADRHEKLYAGIDTFKRLWQGEAVSRRNGAGAEVGIKTFPRPVQAIPSIWITAAGNPDTFRRAGEIGANLLTHLLGQTFGELQEKIEAYRAAWKEAGHPGQGVVTLMLHTYVCETEDDIQSKVKEPFKKYLGSALNLINTIRTELREKGNADDAIPENDVLEMAFNRYYKSSALFGTVESCLGTIATLQKLGIDEFACLIDFGIDINDVIPALTRLTKLKDLANAGTQSRANVPTEPAERPSIGEIVNRHKVTHLQCTPSLMTALLEDRENSAKFVNLRRILVGGESFPDDLASAIRRVTQARIFNVYGPTEATVWATIHEVDPAAKPVMIGRPLSNYQIDVVDSDLKPLPVGIPGELLIAGDSVAIGYFNRPELTAERFVERVDTSGAIRRCYRTGDLACYMPDGVIRHMGRIDDQVKLRGYRIELNEISAQLIATGTFGEAVVLVTGDGTLVRLVAFGTRSDDMQEGVAGNEFALDAASKLRQLLPEYMVPSQFIVCKRFPLTPNKKIDKIALRRMASALVQEKPFVAPSSPTEQKVAEIWMRLLKVPQVSRDDNFFLLGGHSLSLMHLIAEIRNSFGVELSVRTVFTQAVLTDIAEEIERAMSRRKDISRLTQLSKNNNQPVQELII
jgi:natural product biosynthesis luciferase-like monooxygenase protein